MDVHGIKKGFYDVLQARQGKCPPDCHACEDVCARERWNDTTSGIVKISGPENISLEFGSIEVCHQCSQPACMEICPTGAIVKDETDGVVRIIEEKCLGCSLCTLGCSHGNIHYNPNTGKAFKCDLCEGNPKCIARPR